MKISIATLVAAATANMKIPTGESGDKAVSIDQIATYVLTAYDTTFYFDKTNDRLLIGNQTSQSVAGSQANVQINAAGGAYFSVTRFSNNATPPSILFGKSRGASIGTYAALGVNDYVGGIGFAGDDGTDLANVGAGINVKIGATVSSDVVPMTLEFWTANASGTYGIRAYVRYDGKSFFNHEIVSNSDTAGLVLKSANGHYWRFTVNNSGVLSAGSDLGTSI